MVSCLNSQCNNPSVQKAAIVSYLTPNKSLSVWGSLWLLLMILFSSGCSLVEQSQIEEDQTTLSPRENVSRPGRSTKNPEAVAFSPNGRTIASGSFKDVKLWNAVDRSLLSTLKGHSNQVKSVAFSPDGRIVASGSNDRTIKLWNVTNGRLLSTLKGHSDIVTSVAFSPDGRTIASGSRDDSIKLWNVANGKLLSTLKGHSNDVKSVAFSPDGRTIASGSEDSTIKLWNVADGSLLSTLDAHSSGVNSVVFAPQPHGNNSDSPILASAGDFIEPTIKLWNVADSSLLLTIETERQGYPVALAFSNNGVIIASGNGDNTIKLWNVADGSLLSTIEGHFRRVNSLAFSPDDKTIVSTGEDHTIRFWQVP